MIIPAQQECFVVPDKINETCSADTDCLLKGSVCVAERCVCMLHYARLAEECVASKCIVSFKSESARR